MDTFSRVSIHLTEFPSVTCEGKQWFWKQFYWHQINKQTFNGKGKDKS